MNIFISYRRSDSPDVSGRIYDALCSHFGDDMVFKDVDDIPLGVNFSRFLNRILKRTSVMLIVIGSHWLDVTNERGQRRLDLPDDFLRIEVAAALKRKIPIIPLLVQGASMPQQSELPKDLAMLSLYNGIQVRPDPDFHWDIRRLVSHLESYVTPARSADTAQRAPSQPPKRPHQAARPARPMPEPKKQKRRRTFSPFTLVVLANFADLVLTILAWVFWYETLSASYWDILLVAAVAMSVRVVLGGVQWYFQDRRAPKSGWLVVASTAFWVAVDLVIAADRLGVAL